MSFVFSKRLTAKECLAHPWLTRRPKSVSQPADDETAEKKLSTKKLRRFVIRRRWQVTFSFIRNSLVLIVVFFCFSEGSQCSTSITTDGNDVVNNRKQERFVFLSFFCLCLFQSLVFHCEKIFLFIFLFSCCCLPMYACGWKIFFGPSSFFFFSNI